MSCVRTWGVPQSPRRQPAISGFGVERKGQENQETDKQGFKAQPGLSVFNPCQFRSGLPHLLATPTCLDSSFVTFSGPFPEARHVVEAFRSEFQS